MKSRANIDRGNEPMHSLPYRADIDGLRGIAVMAVILFHAEQLGFRGGYLGVDVFFVISGYLITSIVFGQLQRGEFSFVDFYARRARRIVPALVGMVVFTAPLAYAYLLPKDLISFAWSLVSVATFASNFLFGERVGYFDLDAHLEPLLHTWSLAVEEQFYLVFPLLLVACWRWFRHWLMLVVAVIALLSLALTIDQVARRPSFVFFQLAPRAWELLAGALVALYVRRPAIPRLTRATREWGSAVALVLVLASFFVFDETPSAWALNNLVPVIGVCLLLALGLDRTMVGCVLSHKALVFIGLISYSAYLWHQPLFAYVRYVGPVYDTDWMWIGLVGLSLAMGYASYRYIEQPFRRPGFLSSGGVLTCASVALILVVVVSTWVIQMKGFPARLPSGIEWRSLGEKIEKIGDVCTMQPVAGYAGVEACRFGQKDGKRVVALYGDSHAQAIQYELNPQFLAKGLAGVWVKANSCHIVPAIVESGDASQIPVCRSAFHEMRRYFREQVDAVVIVSRWTMRLFPIVGSIDKLGFDNGEGGVEHIRYRTYAAVDDAGKVNMGGDAKRLALTEFLTAMDSITKPVVLVYPIPELGWDIAKVNFHARIMLDELYTSKELYEDRNKFVIDVFDRFEAKNIVKLQVTDLFCDASRCYGQRNKIPLYYDDDHLSADGARVLVEKIMQAIP
jgi:peptidoglycan/LPS O-acetylase OafA/YrhL